MNRELRINDTPLTFEQLVTLMMSLRAFQDQLHSAGFGSDELSQSAKRTCLSGVKSLNDIVCKHLGVYDGA